MAWNVGPERCAAIAALEEQIRQAKVRLDAIGATADSQEVSFHLRDQADLDYGHLSREVRLMEQAFERLTDADDGNDAQAMQEALKLLRRDIES